MRLPRIVTPWLVSAVLAFSSVARLDAHPASTTSVVIALGDRQTFEIAIASDAAALVAKLEALAGAPVSAPIRATREELTARLVLLKTTLVDRAVLSINGVRVPTRPGSVLVDDRGLATMHLETEPQAELQPRGSTLSWSTDLMYGTYPLVIRRSETNETIYWLDGNASSGPITLDQLARPDTSIWSGIWLGFTHIVPKGLDHILFVLGLFLLSPRLGQLLWQVSAFTLAHTVTLGLSLYGLVDIPTEIVEPLIALSVAYVGVENLFVSSLRPWRVAIVFSFGLLHGLGFAGAMSDLPHSRPELLGMLVSFNIGVELGQLSVIGAAALLMCAARQYREAWQAPMARLASAGVGIMGLVWTVERVVGWG